jgi:hypothetical protein
LAQSGYDVAVVDQDAEAIAMAARLDDCRGIHYIAGTAKAAMAVRGGSRYAKAFSIGTMQRLDDRSIRESVAAQLDVADTVIVSAPSDRSPAIAPSRGRRMSPDEWARLLAPVGSTAAHYYGARPLPLREAASAKLLGRLRQDRLHVMAIIRRGGTEALSCAAPREE